MNHNKRTHFLFLRNPIAGLIAAAVTGLVLIGLAVLLVLLPKLSYSHTLESDVEQIKSQRDWVEKRPIPQKADPKELVHLVSQIPMQKETPHFIMTLWNIAQLSKVNLDQLTLENGRLNTGVGGNAIGVVDGALGTPAAESADPKTASAPGKNGTGGNLVFSEESVTVAFHSTYLQAVDFVQRLYSQERLFQITSWSWSDGAKGVINAALNSGQLSVLPAIPEISTSAGKSRMITFTMNLTIYSAPQFKGKFPDLPPIKPLAGAGRKDPTLSDDELVKFLIQASSP